MSIYGSTGTADYLYADITAITAYPFTVKCHLLVPNGFVSGRYPWGLSYSADIDNSDISLGVRTPTTTGYVDFRLSTDSSTAGQANYDIADAVLDDTWASVIVVANSSTDHAVYVENTLIGTSTTNRNVVDQTLDRIFVTNKADGNLSSDTKIAELAIWTAEALGSTDRGNLNTKTPDNIGNDPEYYWALFDNINADIGGVNLTDGGTSSYTQDSGDHPSLTGPSAGSTTPIHYYRMMQS